MTISVPAARGVEPVVPVAVAAPRARSQPAGGAFGAWESVARAITKAATRGWLGLSALLAASAALHLILLLRTPPPFTDEGWNANRAWALVRTGMAFGTTDGGVFEHFPGYWTLMPWLGTWLHTPAIRLLGPSLLAMRLTSLVFGLILLLEVYAVAKRLYGRRVGLLAVAVTSASAPFVYSAHLARHDVMVAVFGFGAIALTLADSGHRFTAKSVLSGLLVGLTLDIHANGLIYGPALASLYLHGSGWSLPRTLRVRRFWGCIAGGLLALAYFAAMHFRYPHTYLTLNRFGPAPTRVPPLLSLDPGVWLESATGMVLFPFIVLPWAAALLGPAALLLWRRRSTADTRLATLGGALAVAFIAIIRLKNGFYGILIMPAACLLIAVLLDDLIDRLARAYRSGSASNRAVEGARSALLLAVLGVSIARGLTPTSADPLGDTRVTLDGIAAVIPRQSVVMGPQNYWFALSPDQPYLSWEQLMYYQMYARGSSLEDAFDALRPDFFIVDSRMERFFPESELPDLDRYLNTDAHLVSSIQTETFRTVRVYRMSWAR